MYDPVGKFYAESFEDIPAEAVEAALHKFSVAELQYLLFSRHSEIIKKHIKQLERPFEIKCDRNCSSASYQVCDCEDIAKMLDQSEIPFVYYNPKKQKYRYIVQRNEFSYDIRTPTPNSRYVEKDTTQLCVLSSYSENIEVDLSGLSRLTTFNAPSKYSLAISGLPNTIKKIDARQCIEFACTLPKSLVHLRIKNASFAEPEFLESFYQLNLEELHTRITYQIRVEDLARFKKLRVLQLHKVCNVDISSLAATSIEELSLYKASDIDITVVKNMHLRQLSLIKSHKIDLTPIKDSSIETLVLNNCSDLTDPRLFDECTNLRHVILRVYPDPSYASHITKLETVTGNFTPIAGKMYPHLHTIQWYKTKTPITIDLSLFPSLQYLKVVENVKVICTGQMPPLKHYTARASDLESLRVLSRADTWHVELENLQFDTYDVKNPIVFSHARTMNFDEYAVPNFDWFCAPEMYSLVVVYRGDDRGNNDDDENMANDILRTPDPDFINAIHKFPKLAEFNFSLGEEVDYGMNCSPMLVKIDLHHRNLRKLTLLNVKIDSQYAKFDLPELVYLKLAGCPLRDIDLSGMPNVRHVDLSFTDIYNLRGLRGCSQIVHLSVNHTMIRTLHGIEHMKHLRRVKAKGTKLYTIAQLAGMRLEYLNISDTYVSSFMGWKPTEETKVLKIDKTLIKCIPFALPKGMERMRVSHNVILHDDINPEILTILRDNGPNNLKRLLLYPDHNDVLNHPAVNREYAEKHGIEKLTKEMIHPQATIEQVWSLCRLYQIAPDVTPPNAKLSDSYLKLFQERIRMRESVYLGPDWINIYKRRYTRLPYWVPEEKLNDAAFCAYVVKCVDSAACLDTRLLPTHKFAGKFVQAWNTIKFIFKNTLKVELLVNQYIKWSRRMVLCMNSLNQTSSERDVITQTLDLCALLREIHNFMHANRHLLNQRSTSMITC